MKQVRFYERKYHTYHGGILLDDGRLLRGDTGEVIEAEKINPFGRYNTALGYDITDVYDTWEDLDEVICGEEYNTSDRVDGKSDVNRMTEWELDDLIKNIIDEREGYLEDNAQDRAIYLDELLNTVRNVADGNASPSAEPFFIGEI